MNKKDIVYFTQDTRKKPDLYIIKEVLEDNLVRLERKMEVIFNIGILNI